MDLPVDWLETDTAALQMVLRRVMENGMRYADHQMAVVVAGQVGGLVGITVVDDGASADHKTGCDGRSVLPGLGDGDRDDGLNSARAIVEARGGSMSVAESPFGQGAAITFTLPGNVVARPRTPSLDEDAVQLQPFMRQGVTVGAEAVGLK